MSSKDKDIPKEIMAKAEISFINSRITLLEKDIAKKKERIAELTRLFLT